MTVVPGGTVDMAQTAVAAATEWTAMERESLMVETVAMGKLVCNKSNISFALRS